jgi:hypothetical protein
LQGYGQARNALSFSQEDKNFIVKALYVMNKVAYAKGEMFYRVFFTDFNRHMIPEGLQDKTAAIVKNQFISKILPKMRAAPVAGSDSHLFGLTVAEHEEFLRIRQTADRQGTHRLGEYQLMRLEREFHAYLHTLRGEI